MQKELNIYDIQYNIKDNKVYFKNKTKIGTLYFNYDYNYDDIEDKILSLSYDGIYENIYDKMKIDETYYLIEEKPWKIVGTVSLYKGYTYIDCAEHDDRVIIKTAFPNEKCNIEGEKF